MKRKIRSLSATKNGFFVNLEKVECFVTANAIDGDILLYEVGGCIPGEKVLGFQLKADKAPLLLVIRFNAIDGVGEYEVGAVENVKSAKIWISRVNKLYECNARTMERISICGIGYQLVGKKFGTKHWNWFLEIDGVVVSDKEMRNHAIGKERGLEFIRKIKPFLPDDAEKMIVPPDCDFGSASFEIMVSKTKDPDAVEKIIIEYFPKLYALAFK